jgi:hypothetical protein
MVLSVILLVELHYTWRYLAILTLGLMGVQIQHVTIFFSLFHAGPQQLFLTKYALCCSGQWKCTICLVNLYHHKITSTCIFLSFLFRRRIGEISQRSWVLCSEAL